MSTLQTVPSSQLSLPVRKAWDILAGITEPLMVQKTLDGYIAYLDFIDLLVANELESGLRSLDKLGEKKPALPLRFSGWVGFCSYDLLAANMGMRLTSKKDFDAPEIYFGRPATLIHIHEEECLVESAHQGRINELLEQSNAQGTQDFSSCGEERHETMHCNLSFEAYSRLFYEALEAIRSGETYQIKISQRYECERKLVPLHLFRRLEALNPSPESFLLSSRDFAMISCSPETVIRKRGSRLQTRPIGGTWEKKSFHDATNESHVRQFDTNEKERHEHNMLVDLERNDLSRICRRGSVQVKAYRSIEPYAHLYHFVSTIEGTVKDGLYPQEIFRAMLPGGTITGCPKWRTMEWIDHLEPVARGPYTGSFGWISDFGDMHMNLIIRTIMGLGSRVFAQAGGGIVVDSSPEYEYNENQLKARALLEVLR